MRLAERYDALLLDLDGVLYRGDEPVPGAARAVASLRGLGCRVVFLTNNSARSPERVAERLRGFGIDASPGDIVTSAHATVPLVRSLLGRGELTAFVIGGEGVRAALRAGGIELLDGEPPQADVVVVGWDGSADYAKLRTASVLVQAGARLVATNADASFPAPGGQLWPGAGALLAAVQTASGARAEVAGKPHPPLFEAALERAGTRNALVVGDRIETDIAGAAASGLDALLVWSGAARPADLLEHAALPVAVGRDVSAALEPLPAARVRPAEGEEAVAARKLVANAGLDEPAGGGAPLVAADGEAVLGTVSVRVQGANAYVHSLAVDEEARGLGLGTLLTAAAAGVARHEGARDIYLVTETARPFFRELGFGALDRDRLPGWIGTLATECATSAEAMHRAITPGS